MDGRSALARSIRDKREAYLGQMPQPVCPSDYALAEGLAVIGGQLQQLNAKALQGDLSQIEARLLTTLIGQHSRLLRQLNARQTARPRHLLDLIRGTFSEVPMLQALVTRETKDGLELSTGTEIIVAPNSFRSIRGKTLASVVMNEVAFWRGEDGANPDIETYRAISPALITLPSSKLWLISSPYRKAGLLYSRHAQHFDADVLVIQAESTDLNPTLDRKQISPPRAYRKPSYAEAEALFNKAPDGPITPAAAEDAPPAVKARVKWFDRAKGFGFLVVDGGEEVLLPIRALLGDHADLAPGTTLTVEISPGRTRRSRVATRVLSIDRSTAIAVGAGPNQLLIAAVRTERGQLARKTASGAGFFESELGGVDVFVPRSCFVDVDVTPGDRIEADIGNGSKGPVALQIRRLPSLG